MTGNNIKFSDKQFEDSLGGKFKTFSKDVDKFNQILDKSINKTIELSKTTNKEMNKLIEQSREYYKTEASEMKKRHEIELQNIKDEFLRKKEIIEKEKAELEKLEKISTINSKKYEQSVSQITDKINKLDKAIEKSKSKPKKTRKESQEEIVMIMERKRLLKDLRTDNQKYAKAETDRVNTLEKLRKTNYDKIIRDNIQEYVRNKNAIDEKQNREREIRKEESDDRELTFKKTKDRTLELDRLADRIEQKRMDKLLSLQKHFDIFGSNLDHFKSFSPILDKTMGVAKTLTGKAIRSVIRPSKARLAKKLEEDDSDEKKSMFSIYKPGVAKQEQQNNNKNFKELGEKVQSVSKSITSGFDKMFIFNMLMKGSLITLAGFAGAFLGNKIYEQIKKAQDKEDEDADKKTKEENDETNNYVKRLDKLKKEGKITPEEYMNIRKQHDFKIQDDLTEYNKQLKSGDVGANVTKDRIDKKQKELDTVISDLENKGFAKTPNATRRIEDFAKIIGEPPKKSEISKQEIEKQKEDVKIKKQNNIIKKEETLNIKQNNINKEKEIIKSKAIKNTTEQNIKKDNIQTSKIRMEQPTQNVTPESIINKYTNRLTSSEKSKIESFKESDEYKKMSDKEKIVAIEKIRLGSTQNTMQQRLIRNQTTQALVDLNSIAKPVKIDDGAKKLEEIKEKEKKVEQIEKTKQQQSTPPTDVSPVTREQQETNRLLKKQINSDRGRQSTISKR